MYSLSDTKFINKFIKDVFPKVEKVPYAEGSVVRKLKIFEDYVNYMIAHKAIEPGREAQLETKYTAKVVKEINNSKTVKLPIKIEG